MLMWWWCSCVYFGYQIVNMYFSQASFGPNRMLWWKHKSSHSFWWGVVCLCCGGSDIRGEILCSCGFRKSLWKSCWSQTWSQKSGGAHGPNDGTLPVVSSHNNVQPCTNSHNAWFGLNEGLNRLLSWQHFIIDQQNQKVKQSVCFYTTNKLHQSLMFLLQLLALNSTDSFHTSSNEPKQTALVWKPPCR